MRWNLLLLLGTAAWAHAAGPHAARACAGALAGRPVAAGTAGELVGGERLVVVGVGPREASVGVPRELVAGHLAVAVGVHPRDPAVSALGVGIGGQLVGTEH